LNSESPLTGPLRLPQPRAVSRWDHEFPGSGASEVATIRIPHSDFPPQVGDRSPAATDRPAATTPLEANSLCQHAAGPKGLRSVHGGDTEWGYDDSPTFRQLVDILEPAERRIA
jgi:hypothetical protein